MIALTPVCTAFFVVLGIENLRPSHQPTRPSSGVSSRAPVSTPKKATGPTRPPETQPEGTGATSVTPPRSLASLSLVTGQEIRNGAILFVGTYVSSKVSYANASPSTDEIEIQLKYAAGSHTIHSCGTRVLYAEGSLGCPWGQLDAGEYKVIAYLNGDMRATAKFRIMRY